MAASVLARLRRHLGFRPAEVAAECGWSPHAFTAIEADPDPPVEVGLKLSEAYGVDVLGILETGRITRDLVPLGTLLKGNADVLTARARFAMTGAMAVARDLREVEDALEIAVSIPVTSFKDSESLAHPDSGNAKRLASHVRKVLKLPAVVPSLVMDVCQPLGITVFALPFADITVDAFSMWSEDTGAVVVVNSDHAGLGVLALRATLAHEVCHLLFDRRKMRGIRHFCEVDRPEVSSWAEENERIERRARAFQVELIAPQAHLMQRRKALKGSPANRIRELALEFGLGPVAVAWQLANAGGPSYQEADTHLNLGANGWPEWEQLLPGDAPLTVPELRRGRIYELVQYGVVRGEISHSWGRELLRLSLHDWENLVRKWTSS